MNKTVYIALYISLFYYTILSMNNLPQKIKKLRLDKGWSIRKMASKIPMSHSGYANIESGRTPPARDRIQQIASIHKLNPAELVHEKSLPLNELDNQHKIDDLYDILGGINRDLQLVLAAINSIKKSNRFPN